MLAPDEQREIAKVYISAFLEETLQRQEQEQQEQESYLALFQDYRAGMSWLPDTDYYNRFESGSFIPWARFDEDTNRASIPGGGKAEASGLIWTEQNAKNRHNVSKPTRGIVLERSESVARRRRLRLRSAMGARRPRSRAGRVRSRMVVLFIGGLKP